MGNYQTRLCPTHTVNVTWLVCTWLYFRHEGCRSSQIREASVRGVSHYQYLTRIHFVYLSFKFWVSGCKIGLSVTAQKMKFSFKDFLSKRDHIHILYFLCGVYIGNGLDEMCLDSLKIRCKVLLWWSFLWKDSSLGEWGSRKVINQCRDKSKNKFLWKEEITKVARFSRSN